MNGDARTESYEEPGGFDFTDRYSALGIPRPPERLVCKGLCEGSGWVPIYMAEGDHRSDDGGALAVVSSEHDERWVALWREAEAAEPCDDGWHFVACPDCGGTGIDGAPSDRNHYRGPAHTEHGATK